MGRVATKATYMTFMMFWERHTYTEVVFLTEKYFIVWSKKLFAEFL
jgi:hypothetical protein